MSRVLKFLILGIILVALTFVGATPHHRVIHKNCYHGHYYVYAIDGVYCEVSYETWSKLRPGEDVYYSYNWDQNCRNVWDIP